MIALVLAFAIPLVALLLLRSPNAPMVVWAIAATLLPPWVQGAVANTRLAPTALVSAAVIIAMWRRCAPRWNTVDTTVLALILSLGVASAFDTPLFLVAQGMGEWGLCYAAGRYAFTASDRRGPHALVLIGAALGLAATLQLALGFNVADWLPGGDGTPSAAWKELQFRNDLPRAELAFGHSIALGGVLTLILPFALFRPRPRGWLTMGALILLGVIATQSRAAIVAAAVIVVIAVARSSLDRAWRLLALALCIVVFAFYLPSLLANFVLGGSDSTSEVAQGSLYRVTLLELVGFVSPSGLGSEATRSVDGATFLWGSARSIDNGLLYVALFAGFITALFYLLATARAVWGGYRNGQIAASVGLLAQLPFVLTVAPITQHQSVFWFMVAGAASNWLPSPDIRVRPSTRRPVVEA